MKKRLVAHPSSRPYGYPYRRIRRIDGGSATTNATSLGPDDLDALLYVANNLQQATIDFKYYDNWFVAEHWIVRFSCGSAAKEHIEKLLNKLGIPTPHSFKGNGGRWTLTYYNQSNARRCQSALDACCTLGKELQSLKDVNLRYTIDSLYYGQGHRYYAVGKTFGNTSVVVEYIIPFVDEKYVATQEFLQKKAEQDLLISQQTLEASENNNKAGQLDNETAHTLADTLAQQAKNNVTRTLIIAGAVFVAALVVVAVVLVVKRHRK